MKVISLSLFGYNNKNKDCYSFENFVALFNTSLRAYNIFFNDFKIALHVDRVSYYAYQRYFDFLVENKFVYHLQILDQASLCRAMLWRLNPVQWADYTICRDIDYMPTIKDRMAVQVFMRNKTICHAISDNPSHTVKLMGGMIGFRKNAFDLKIINSCGMNFDTKGDDQTFLDTYIWHIVKKSITQHRLKGLPCDASNIFSYNFIQNIEINTQQFSSEFAVNFIKNKQKVYRQNKLSNFIGAPYRITASDGYQGAYNVMQQIGDSVVNKKLRQIQDQYPFIFKDIINQLKNDDRVIDGYKQGINND